MNEQRRLAAIVSADVAGYSRLMECRLQEAVNAAQGSAPSPHSSASIQLDDPTQ
jgi:hypothetical protein